MAVKAQEPRYESIADFLAGDINPWEYDFKYQYENINPTLYWNLNSEQDNIIRLLKYKVERKDGKAGGRFDCDGSGTGEEKYVCWLTREIYRTLWDWQDEINPNEKEKKKRRVKRYGPLGSNEWLSFGPDTMNSFLTLFNYALETSKKKNVLSDYKNFINEKYFNGKDKQKNVSITFLYRLLVEHKDDTGVDLSDYLNDLGFWKAYAAKHHTIGNFVLVPAGYNPDRNSMFHDFWNLSLQYLKQQASGNAWLSKSCIFERYINYFFLWDYVACDEEKSTYYVKSLLLNEFQSGNEYNSSYLVSDRAMPTEKEIPIFLENALWVIRRRGIFMTAMLQLQADKEKGGIGLDMYNKLRAEIFASALCYHGFGEVLWRILDWLDRDKILLPEKVCEFLKKEPEFKETIENYESEK